MTSPTQFQQLSQVREVYSQQLKYVLPYKSLPQSDRLSLVCEADNSCSSSKLIGFIIYETFSFLWTSQVVGNVALATLAGGPFGSKASDTNLRVCLLTRTHPGWYYFGPREQGLMVGVLTPLRRQPLIEIVHQPKHPTLTSFVRASTLSLGSIAFGSLIVTILELIRMILNAARNSANADGHRTSPVTIVNSNVR